MNYSFQKLRFLEIWMRLVSALELLARHPIAILQRGCWFGNEKGTHGGVPVESAGFNHRFIIGNPEADVNPAESPYLSNMTPNFLKIDHVSVLITDVGQSRTFYRDLLGLKEIAKPRTFDFVALWFDLGDQQLHLLRADEPDARSPRHFALRVADVPAARAYFRDKGVPIQETTVIPGCDRFFLFDPDGNRIEIIQWIDAYDPARSGAATVDVE